MIKYYFNTLTNPFKYFFNFISILFLLITPFNIFILIFLTCFYLSLLSHQLIPHFLFYSIASIPSYSFYYIILFTLLHNSKQLIQISKTLIIYYQLSVFTQYTLMVRIPPLSLIIITLLLYLSLNQQCKTKFDLDNLLQDQITINPQQGNPIFQTQSYFYPRTFFTSTPKIFASIQSYQIKDFTSINYFLTTRVNRSNVTFTFNAQNMNWVTLRIKFWLSARADLLIGSFILQNINPSSSKNFDIVIPSTFNSFIDQKTIQLNYITGLKASTTNNIYQIDVKNSGRSADNSQFTVTVNALNQTTIIRIQVSYTIFNFQSSFFASGGGQITYNPINGFQHKKIHGSFSPILYQIQGFDKVRLQQNNGLNLQFSVDSDFVLSTHALTKFDQLGVVYLSIGAQPSGVCSCDQFIMKSGCIDNCPAMTYPFIDYAKGGKSCLTCSPKFNQTIDQFNTKCVCLEGLQRVDEYCIPKAKQITQCTAKNRILSNGACVCIAGTQLVNGNCQSICNKNQNYNSNSAKCECNFGYYNISGVCNVCDNDKIYNANLLACVCPDFQYIPNSDNACKCVPTYLNYSGTCVRTCPTGFIKQSNSCVPNIGNCSNSQVFENGQCVCKNNTYIVNGTCTTCPSTTYYNRTSQTCINCMAHCDVCFNFSSCSTCRKDYFYNQVTNQCVMNRTCLQNQVFNSNSGFCECTNGLVEVNGVCTSCLAGTFYNKISKICQNCVLSCLSCTNANSCDNCLPNYNYNPILGYCAPNCGANQTLVNGNCECIGNTYRINGVCTKCPSTQYYDNNSKSCQSCISNCISCTNPTICDKCILTHYFNISSKLCEPSNCPINETIINSRCDCVENTYRINGICSVCKQDQYYQNNTQTCKQCTDNCVKCLNQLHCGQCQPYFKLVNNECKFNLYDLKNGSPQFTGDKIIITDFVSSQPNKSRKLSQQQLNKLVKIQFDPKQTKPLSTIIQQNPKNSSQLRIIFGYCDYVPIDKFNTTYTFNDPSISIKEDIQTVNYNLLQKGFTNYLTQ